MQGPCKDCEHLGCGSYHDQCEKYQEFKTQLATISKEMRKDNENKVSKIKGIRRMKTKRNTNGVVKTHRK